MNLYGFYEGIGSSLFWSNHPHFVSYYTWNSHFILPHITIFITPHCLLTIHADRFHTSRAYIKICVAYLLQFHLIISLTFLCYNSTFHWPYIISAIIKTKMRKQSTLYKNFHAYFLICCLLHGKVETLYGIDLNILYHLLRIICSILFNTII